MKLKQLGYGIATYLPYVWRDGLPNANAADVLDELSEKAGERNGWRNDPNSTVQLYKTYKFEF